MFEDEQWEAKGTGCGRSFVLYDELSFAVASDGSNAMPQAFLALYVMRPTRFGKEI